MNVYDEQREFLDDMLADLEAGKMTSEGMQAAMLYSIALSLIKISKQMDDDE